jgi:hypothetical protein
MNLLNKIIRTIQTDPNTRNPVLWASWLVPMVVTPLARYASDQERNQDDRLELSIEMFALYGIGTLLYFSFNPLTAALTKQLFPKKSKSFHSLACGITGSLASALFSGFYSSRLGNWLKHSIDHASNKETGNNLIPNSVTFPVNTYASSSLFGKQTGLQSNFNARYISNQTRYSSCKI